MVKAALRLFYRFCDSLDRVMLAWCEYDRHKAGSQAYLDALRLEVFPFYAGPHDGGQIRYAGLIIRVPDHGEGAYCFDGESYRWIAKDPVSKKE
jgi:hypothetical protein